MSDYDDRRGGRRRTRTKEPQYVEEEDEYIARGAPTRDLVLRPRDDDYDDYRAPAEVRRRSYREEYGPPARRARSHGYRDYDDDDYSEYAPRNRRRQSRYDEDYYSDDDQFDRRRGRRKSKVGEIVEDLGLGGVVAAVMNKTRSRSRKRRDSGSDRDYYSRRGSRSRSAENRKKWQQAAKAAVITGVIEAVRSRNEPGGWQGKGTRVATAALGAAGIDGLLDRDPDRKSKRHIVESVVGGLAVNHVASGPRDKSEPRGRSKSRSGRSRSRSIVAQIRSRSRSVFGRSRSRSVFGRSRSRSVSRAGSDRGRSQSRGPGLKGAAALGGLAVAGKAIYDRVRSKSRGRLRGRSRSVGSEDSYVPSRRPRYAQNRENRGGPNNARDRDRDRDRNRDDDDDDDDDNNDNSRGRQAEQKAGGGNRDRSSSTSSISTTDLENRRKKTRGKELLTAGLATVATIHAAHGVYSSMVASEKRHKMVMEGEMSPEEARKRKSKNMLQDAAAVGIAALGIKSAFGEWKEMNESRKEKHEIEARHRRRLKQRQKREREMKENGGGNGGNQQLTYPPVAVGAYPPGPGMAPYYPDANPYHAYAVNPNLPPPPVGGR